MLQRCWWSRGTMPTLETMELWLNKTWSWGPGSWAGLCPPRQNRITWPLLWCSSHLLVSTQLPNSWKRESANTVWCRLWQEWGNDAFKHSGCGRGVPYSVAVQVLNCVKAAHLEGPIYITDTYEFVWKNADRFGDSGLLSPGSGAIPFFINPMDQWSCTRSGEHTDTRSPVTYARVSSSFLRGPVPSPRP